MKNKFLKTAIILSLASTLVQAQTTNEHTESEAPLKNSEGKIITFKDVETIINGDIVTTNTTFTRKLDNATKFFPDNICLPVAPGSMKTSVASLTFNDLNNDMKVLIESAKESIKSKFELETKEIKIVAAATSAAATLDVPGNAGEYSKEQVEMCYGGQKPTNAILAQARADNLKATIEKFIPELKTIGANITTKTLLNQKDRYVKVEGLVFSKSMSGERMVGQVGCGEKVGITGGSQGNSSKNYLFQDLPGLSSTDYTRSIAVYGKGEVTIKFDAKTIPDRFEAYAVPKDDKKQRIRLDKQDAFVGRLLHFQAGEGNKVESSFPYASFKGMSGKVGFDLSPHEAYLKGITDAFLKSGQGSSYYGAWKLGNGNIAKAEDVWKGLIGTKISNPKIKRVDGAVSETYIIKDKGYSHVVIKVFSPFDGTIFDIDSSCK